MAAIFATPVQRPSQAVSDGHADNYAHGTYGAGGHVTIMGRTHQGKPATTEEREIFLLLIDGVCDDIGYRHH